MALPEFLFAFGNVDLQEATYGIGLAEEEDALLSGEDFCNSICKNEEAGIDATQQARYAAYLQVAPPEIAELAVNGAVETLYDIFEHWEKTGLDVADFFEVSPRGVQQAIAAAEPKQALPVISSGAMSPTSSCSVDEAILGADTFELALPADLRGSQHARGNATGSALAVRNGGITKASRARSRPATPPLAIPVSFKWLAPSRSKDRPLQGNAKSNATVLLTGCRLDISVNSLLLEDNAMFEAMVPPAVTANGLTLAHPPRLFLAATLLCLMDGIPNEELVERYGLRDIPKMREGHPLDKAIMKRLFPRRKKGTTKYELSEGIAALFRDRNLAWPAFTITDAQAEYLIGKYGKQAVDQ